MLSGNLAQLAQRREPLGDLGDLDDRELQLAHRRLGALHALPEILVRALRVHGAPLELVERPLEAAHALAAVAAAEEEAEAQHAEREQTEAAISSPSTTGSRVTTRPVPARLA